VNPMQVRFESKAPDADHALVLAVTGHDDDALGTLGADGDAVASALRTQRFDGKTGKAATGYLSSADGRRVLVEGPTALSAVLGLVQGLMA